MATEELIKVKTRFANKLLKNFWTPKEDGRKKSVLLNAESGDAEDLFRLVCWGYDNHPFTDVKIGTKGFRTPHTVARRRSNTQINLRDHLPAFILLQMPGMSDLSFSRRGQTCPEKHLVSNWRVNSGNGGFPVFIFFTMGGWGKRFYGLSILDWGSKGHIKHFIVSPCRGWMEKRNNENENPGKTRMQRRNSCERGQLYRRNFA